MELWIRWEALWLSSSNQTSTIPKCLSENLTDLCVGAGGFTIRTALMKLVKGDTVLTPTPISDYDSPSACGSSVRGSPNSVTTPRLSSRIWFGVEWEHVSINILVKKACDLTHINLSYGLQAGMLENTREPLSYDSKKPTRLLSKSQK